MRILKYVLPLVCIVITGWAVAGNAEEPTKTSQSEYCLSLMSIDDLDVIDNQNIAFRMKNHKYYLNHLPHTCPMLDNDRVIMYKTSLNRLCNLDIIDVLDHIGGGFQYYGSCGLGKFEPVSKEVIQQMKDKAKESKAAKQR